MIFDPHRLATITKSGYITAIDAAYGAEGSRLLTLLVSRIRLLYIHVLPQSIDGHLVALISTSGSKSSIHKEEIEYTNLGDLAAHIKSIESGNVTIIMRVQPEGRIYGALIQNADLDNLPNDTIQYHYESFQEYFMVGNNKLEIPNSSSCHVSAFSIPTYSDYTDLEIALEDYMVRSIKRSSCFIFKEAWHQDERLYLKNRPEKLIRRSLMQYLINVFGAGIDVQPESPTDETKPVDITITWFFNNRQTLIEIKWIGKSINAKEDDLTENTPYDARSGATQLAGYLDRKEDFGPIKLITGILIVIDARRKGITLESDSVDRQNGYHYEHADIAYNPDYHKIRDDFEPPKRMFAEPVCNP